MSPSFYACMPESCLSLIWFLSLQNLRCTREQGNMEFNLLLKMQDYSPPAPPPFSTLLFCSCSALQNIARKHPDAWKIHIMLMFFSFLFRVVFINFFCFYLSYSCFWPCQHSLNLKLDWFWRAFCLSWWRSGQLSWFFVVEEFSTSLGNLTKT